MNPLSRTTLTLLSQQFSPQLGTKNGISDYVSTVNRKIFFW